MQAFTIEEMTENSAAQIASWKYPPPYELYSFGGNAAEREELLTGLHFAAYQASLGEEPCGVRCGEETGSGAFPKAQKAVSPRQKRRAGRYIPGHQPVL